MRNWTVDTLFDLVAAFSSGRAIGIILSGPWTTDPAGWRPSTRPRD